MKAPVSIGNGRGIRIVHGNQTDVVLLMGNQMTNQGCCGGLVIGSDRGDGNSLQLFINQDGREVIGSQTEHTGIKIFSVNRHADDAAYAQISQKYNFFVFPLPVAVGEPRDQAVAFFLRKLICGVQEIQPEAGGDVF